MKIQSTHVLLFQRLALSDPNFDPFAYMKKVSQLPTNKAKVDFVYEEINKHHLFPKVVADVKNDFVAEEHRQSGNRHLESGYFFTALEDYTRSVATAQTKTSQGMAYSDRSASLCRLGLHKCAITDIERALEIGPPKVIKSKLRVRLNKAKRQQDPLEAYFEEIPKFRNSERNATIQCASNCIKIKSVDSFGRTIVANRDIKIGEILAIESPYAAVVTVDRLIHCTNCLELCYNPIPCDNCTLALFCSTYCKDKAQGYHQYECPILLTLHEIAADSALVPLRIAILARDEYESLDIESPSMDEYYCSDRYREVHNLNSALEFAEDELYCFLTTVTASVLVYLLKRCTHFFMGSKSIEDAFKEVIMRQLQNASSNSAKISEYTRNVLTQTYERQYFAEGIYPFFALFNHSCCNNVTRSFHGSTMVLHAINSIKKGEQCFVNYGCHYGTTPKFVRQTSLSTSYFFDCTCRACEGDWKPDCVNLQLVLKNSAIDVQRKLALQADVHFARQFLKRLVQWLKRCEKNEPLGRALLIKTKIIQCHEILGNKRRI